VPEGALRAGTPVSALPSGYGLVLGKVQVTVGGEPLQCAAVRASAACGLVARYETGETLLMPHQPPASLAAHKPPGPFFAIRLPEEAYEMTRFDVPREAARVAEEIDPVAAPRLRVELLE